MAPVPLVRRSGPLPRYGGPCHNWVGVRGVTPISRANRCPDGRPIFLPRRRFRWDSRPRVLASGRAFAGILNSGPASRRVELAHGPSGRWVELALKNLLH